VFRHAGIALGRGRESGTESRRAKLATLTLLVGLLVDVKAVFARLAPRFSALAEFFLPVGEEAIEPFARPAAPRNHVRSRTIGDDGDAVR